MSVDDSAARLGQIPQFRKRSEIPLLGTCFQIETVTPLVDHGHMSTQASTDRPAAVVARVRELMVATETMSLAAALDLCGEIDGIVDAARSRRLSHAMAAAADAGQDPMKVARSAAGRDGRCSRREADRSAKRARAVGANACLLYTSDAADE